MKKSIDVYVDYADVDNEKTTMMESWVTNFAKDLKKELARGSLNSEINVTWRDAQQEASANQFGEEIAAQENDNPRIYCVIVSPGYVRAHGAADRIASWMDGEQQPCIIEKFPWQSAIDQIDDDGEGQKLQGMLRQLSERHLERFWTDGESSVPHTICQPFVHKIHPAEYRDYLGKISRISQTIVSRLEQEPSRILPTTMQSSPNKEPFDQEVGPLILCHKSVENPEADAAALGLEGVIKTKPRHEYYENFDNVVFVLKEDSEAGQKWVTRQLRELAKKAVSRAHGYDSVYIKIVDAEDQPSWVEEVLEEVIADHALDIG